jgi:hypothetical protein
MYHDYPELEAAYECPQQYAFGPELIAAPFTSPALPEMGLARQEVWLPEGDWYDFFTGEHYRGGGKVVMYGRLRDIPVFARAGAIVPLGPDVGWGGVDVPDELHIHLFAGANGRFVLYEDDGETTAYKFGTHAQTEITQAWSDDAWWITIEAPAGVTDLLPETRTVTLYLHGIKQPEQWQLTIEREVVTAVSQYDSHTETCQIQGVALPKGSSLNLAVTAKGESLLSHRDRIDEKCFAMLRAFHLPTVTKSGIADYLPKVRANPDLLDEFTPNLSQNQMRALLDIIVN